MAEGNPDFYGETLERLRRDGRLCADHSILVVCGGPVDRTVMHDHGFTDVTISNIDPRQDPGAFAPYPWVYQDAEELTFEDGSFDFCVVHSGLHHCRSPQRALLEMYRVARRGVLIFEPYDNFTTRLGVRLGVGQEYEHASVARNGLTFGGVANTAIPNYVYRFTSDEIRKAVSSYDPTVSPNIDLFFRMDIPWSQLRKRPRKWAYWGVRTARPLIRVLERIAPAQSNNFGAFIAKPDPSTQLHPWLRFEGDAVVLDEEWIAGRYGA